VADLSGRDAEASDRHTYERRETGHSSRNRPHSVSTVPSLPALPGSEEGPAIDYYR